MDGARDWCDGSGGAVLTEHMPGKKGGGQSQVTSTAKKGLREK